MIGFTLAILLSSAAQEAGSRIPPRAAPATASGRGDTRLEARRVMHDYARCVVAEDRPAVERFLAVLPGSANEAKLGSRIATGDCLGDGTLRFAPMLFRGALYERLYRADFATSFPSALAAVPAIDYAPGDGSALTQRQRGYIALQRFGDCAARAKPDVARRLVLSEVGSASETAAITELSPALGPCLSQGMEVDFSRPLLRGVIAEGVYRLSVAARGAAGGGER